MQGNVVLSLQQPNSTRSLTMGHLSSSKDEAQSEIEMSEEVMLKHVWKMKNEESPGPDNTCLRVLQGLRNKMIAYFH